MKKKSPHVEDEEISKRFKQASFQLEPYRLFKPTQPDPPTMSRADQEYYWKSLMSDPLCRQQK